MVAVAIIAVPRASDVNTTIIVLDVERPESNFLIACLRCANAASQDETGDQRDLFLGGLLKLCS
jgi:hypothetical protein